MNIVIAINHLHPIIFPGPIHQKSQFHPGAAPQQRNGTADFADSRGYGGIAQGDILRAAIDDTLGHEGKNGVGTVPVRGGIPPAFVAFPMQARCLRYNAP